MTDYPATVTPTQYTVSCVPETVDGYYHFQIIVQHRGDSRWAIYQGTTNGGPVWNQQQQSWDYESSQDRDDEQWMADHRFGLDEALAIAKKVAPTLTVGRLDDPWTVERIMKERHATSS